MQLFAATDASEADALQAATEGLQVTAGRRDAWEMVQAHTAFELASRVTALQKRVGELQVREWFCKMLHEAMLFRLLAQPCHILSTPDLQIVAGRTHAAELQDVIPLTL